MLISNVGDYLLFNILKCLILFWFDPFKRLGQKTEILQKRFAVWEIPRHQNFILILTDWPLGQQ